MSYDAEAYAALKVWAEMFFDAQQARIRSSNRVLRAPVFPELFAEELAAAVATENRIGLRLARQYRKTAPSGVVAWQKASLGVGEHTVARLLGHLGHPRIATPSHWEGAGSERKLIADEPFLRSHAQLWQYCGHGAAGRPQKGMTAVELAALGCPSLKMIVRLLAECAVKQPGRRIADLLARLPKIATISNVHPVAEPPLPQPKTRSESKLVAAGDPLTTPPILGPTWPYRAVYEQRRIDTLGRTHADPCVRCGPSGRPAQPGSEWSDAHAHNDALRLVGKAILRDLWLAAEDES